MRHLSQRCGTYNASLVEIVKEILLTEVALFSLVLNEHRVRQSL